MSVLTLFTLRIQLVRKVSDLHNNRDARPLFSNHSFLWSEGNVFLVVISGGSLVFIFGVSWGRSKAADSRWQIALAIFVTCGVRAHFLRIWFSEG